MGQIGLRGFQKKPKKLDIIYERSLIVRQQVDTYVNVL